VPGALTLLLTMCVFGGLMFMSALYIQNGLGHGALETGLMFVPASLVFAAVSLRWQLLPATWHRRLPAVGMPVATAGFASLAWALATDRPIAVLLTVMTAASLGLGVAYSPVMTLALRRVPPPLAPDASGLMVTVIQLGQVLGVAAFGTLYLSTGSGIHEAGRNAALAIAATALAATVPAARLGRPGGG
jgi:hypothetical protein